MLIWTLSGQADYSLTQNEPSTWLSLSETKGRTDSYGYPVQLNLDAQGLAPGNYTIQYSAEASGFSSASLDISLTVVEKGKKRPRVLYLYGNVDEFGVLATNVSSYSGQAYHPMRLSDNESLGMSEFKKAIEDVGFEIVEMYDQDLVLEDQLLNQYNVLILASNQKQWSSDEQAALDRWVRAGGGLIAYSDPNFGGNYGNLQPAGIKNKVGRDSDNRLTEQFGMIFYVGQNGYGTNLVNQWEIPHFLNTKNGLPRSLQFEGELCSPIRILPDWPQKQAQDTVYQIARFQNGGRGGPTTISDPDFGNNLPPNEINSALAAAEIGQGRVVGTFDATTFLNYGENTHIGKEDNRLFAQKLLLWVSGRDAVTHPVHLSGEQKQWHNLTLSFEGPIVNETDSINPFLDYRLEVIFFQGEDTLRVPGYFAADGNAAETSASTGNIWRVHFVPQQTGTWSYRASFRIAKDVAVADDPEAGIPSYFDGLSGSFEVTQTDKSAPDLRSKGFLQYVGHHYLRFQDGSWFIKAGSNSPETFLAYEDFDGTFPRQLLSDSSNAVKNWAAHLPDWDPGDPEWQGNKGRGIIGAINYLAQKGNNAFSFLTYNAGGDGDNVWPFIAPDQRRRYDCSKLDQWDIVFAHADRQGMFLHFKTQETKNDNESPSGLDEGELETERKLYYRELIARFSYHLALNWNLGEENSQTSAQIKAMAQYFHENDPYQHPIVIHNADPAVFEPLLGNNSSLTGPSLQGPYQTAHELTRDWIKKSEQSGKKWVVCHDKQNSYRYGVPPDDTFPGSSEQPEDAPTQDDIRKYTLWGNLMAGGGGVEYYFGYDLPQNDLNAQNWRSRDQMWDYNRYALEFFHRYQIPFWEMQSSDSLVHSPAGYEHYCLAHPGETYLVYLSQGENVSLKMEEAHFNAYFEVYWYDPRMGGILQQGAIRAFEGQALVSLGSAPYDEDQDWVVLVRRSSQPLPIEPLPQPKPQAPEEDALRVYPNPATDLIQISYHPGPQQAPRQVWVALVDAWGIKRGEKSLQKSMGFGRVN
ncbi:MAG: DUF5060 domain-containing protein [Bacteroidia bacterium]|nr:DUF5060 domain-containing protein [Bacteroidia bacterium]